MSQSIVFAVYVKQKYDNPGFIDQVIRAESLLHAQILVAEIAEDHGYFPSPDTGPIYPPDEIVDLGSVTVGILRSDEWDPVDVQTNEDADLDGELEFQEVQPDAADITARGVRLVRYVYIDD